MSTGFTHGYCAMCEKHDYVGPLNGERGGPNCCLLCIGKWDAEQGPLRRARLALTNSSWLATSSNRDRWTRTILALLDRHSAVYLNDLLPNRRTRAQYQRLRRVVAGLEDAREIETQEYWTRFTYPGHKVLVKPGYTIKDRDDIALLKNRERLTTAHQNSAAETLEAAE
jgi:hypothetical protein